ncbi:MAG: hypothetical protein ACYDCK_15265 [Thermoplasmatota archaeon]
MTTKFETLERESTNYARDRFAEVSLRCVSDEHGARFFVALQNGSVLRDGSKEWTSMACLPADPVAARVVVALLSAAVDRAERLAIKEAERVATSDTSPDASVPASAGASA